jgi:AcrR family transcriptional regulator
MEDIVAQYKKDEVRGSIDAAALSVFAEKGYMAAKVSDISERAGVSVGNIYRYYKNKDEIFYSVVPEEFPALLLSAVTNKISAAKKGLKINTEGFEEVSSEFISFMMAHRQMLKILFSGSEGTRYEHVKPEMAKRILAQVKRIYAEAYDLYIKRWGSVDMLNLIYIHLIDAYGYVLGSEGGDEALISKIKQINVYHFSGITSLLNI